MDTIKLFDAMEAREIQIYQLAFAFYYRSMNVCVFKFHKMCSHPMTNLIDKKKILVLLNMIVSYIPNFKRLSITVLDRVQV